LQFVLLSINDNNRGISILVILKIIIQTFPGLFVLALAMALVLEFVFVFKLILVFILMFVLVLLLTSTLVLLLALALYSTIVVVFVFRSFDFGPILLVHYRIVIDVIR